MKRVFRITLQVKLIGAFVLATFFVMGFGYVGYSSVNKLAVQLNEMGQVFLPSAQSLLTIEVHDAKTLEPLVGVTVTIPALKIGASTDATGKVNLSTTETGTHEVKVSYLGYQTWQQTIVVPGTVSTMIS